MTLSSTCPFMPAGGVPQCCDRAAAGSALCIVELACGSYSQLATGLSQDTLPWVEGLCLGAEPARGAVRA